MATIHKLPSGNWRVQIRQNGSNIEKTFPLKKTAGDWAKSMKGNQDEIDAFPDAEARKRTVAQAIDAYMLDYSGRDVGLTNRLAWWRAEIGTVSLANLTQAKIKDAIRKLGRRGSPIHIITLLQSLSSGGSLSSGWQSP